MEVSGYLLQELFHLMQTLLKLVGNFAQGICRIHPSSGDHRGVGVNLEWLILLMVFSMMMI